MLSYHDLPSFRLGTSCGLLLVLSVIYYTLWIIYARFFHPLRQIPGPFLASITQWWLFRTARYGISDNSRYPLHAKYGPVVRIAPNQVSVGDASALDIVYGTKPVWQKTEFYEAFDPHIGDRKELFTTRDEKAHTSRKRLVAHLYSSKAMLEYEPRVDRCIADFVSRLSPVGNTAGTLDMSRTLRQYTADVIAEVFYGKEGGFHALVEDIDYNNWMKMIDVLIPTVSSLGYIPQGFHTLYFMLQLFSNETRKGLKAFQAVVTESRATVERRVQEEKAYGGSSRNDMLSKLLAVVAEKGEKEDFTHDDVAVNVFDAIMAGSDTTGHSLAHLFYLVVRDRRVYEQLAAEVRSAYDTGSLSSPVRYTDTLTLPYLDACVKESSRYSSSGNLGFPRYVPPGGATLAGHFLAGGCKVSMNPNVVHYDQGCFGWDAETFRPERWIENDPETIANMNRHHFAFGMGTRVCLGKHLANVEMYKLLPALLNEFDFELVNDWTVTNHWFRKVSDLNMRITRRR